MHVPFAGAGPAIQATIGGHTPIAFTALPPALAAVQDGHLRAIGVAAAAARGGNARCADLRRAGDQGPGSRHDHRPRRAGRTPKEIVDLLYREIAKAFAPARCQGEPDQLGFTAVADTPDEFGQRIKVEIDKWGKVVHDAKLRIE